MQISFEINKIHTCHSRFVAEGVAETSQSFLQDAHVLPKLAVRNTADVTGCKPSLSDRIPSQV
jgi:hypothetical protein